MVQQDPLQVHLPSARMTAWQHAAHMRVDDSSTFVNPLHEGSSQWISPYDFSPETAIPPPPPGIDVACASHAKRNRGYRIALAVLIVLVVALGELSVMQVTTNLRTVWTIRLQNESGAQQIDYFAEFSLQDPFGNRYDGTGNLNTDFFLDAGQTAMKTEIFSFLPNPSTTYTLTTRLGISGTTYDPFQVTL
jgi:hypothetical protein